MQNSGSDGVSESGESMTASSASVNIADIAAHRRLETLQTSGANGARAAWRLRGAAIRQQAA